MCCKPAPVRGQTWLLSVLVVYYKCLCVWQWLHKTWHAPCSSTKWSHMSGTSMQTKTAKSQKERLANMHAMRSVPASPQHNKTNAETEHWISRLQLQLKIVQFFSKVLYVDVAAHTTAVLSCGSCVFPACPNLNLLNSHNWTLFFFFLKTPCYFQSCFL